MSCEKIGKGLDRPALITFLRTTNEENVNEKK